MGFGKDGTGVIIGESRAFALATLDADAGAFITTKLNTLERFRMLKSRMVSNVEGLTAADGESLTLWLADGDLSIGEVEAAIEVDGPLGPNDTVPAAVAERAVFYVGAYDVKANQTEGFLRDKEGAGYAAMVKPRWTFGRTKSWNWVIYNLGPPVDDWGFCEHSG